LREGEGAGERERGEREREREKLREREGGVNEMLSSDHGFNVAFDLFNIDSFNFKC